MPAFQPHPWLLGQVAVEPHVRDVDDGTGERVDRRLVLLEHDLGQPVVRSDGDRELRRSW